MSPMDGALLVNKHAGVSSFGVIELLQKQLMDANSLKRRDLPKMGHGGTLDPFATGLLTVCVGRAVKLARYFLGATKGYRGVIRFGETTATGDPTSPVIQSSDSLPSSKEQLQELATQLTRQPYLQTPPMFSAKKKDGRPLYELAREGIEVEREPKLCQLYDFRVFGYSDRRAEFEVTCSSGTYIRTLAQDFGRMLGTVALLESLERTSAGAFKNAEAWTVAQLAEATARGESWSELPCWVPFDRLLDGYEHAEATVEEAEQLFQGRQNVLFNILRRARPGTRGQESCLAIFNEHKLIAVARREGEVWGLERVFLPG